MWEKNLGRRKDRENATKVRTAPVASEERCQDEGWMLQCAGVGGAAGGGAPGGGREVLWRHPLRTNHRQPTDQPVQGQPQGVQGEQWRLFSIQYYYAVSSIQFFQTAP